jgi:hypothetical protein
MRYILASSWRDLNCEKLDRQSVFEPRLEHGGSRIQWSTNFAKLTLRLVGSSDYGNKHLGSLSRQEKFLTRWTTIRPTWKGAPSRRKSFTLPYKFLTSCVHVCVRAVRARVSSSQPRQCVLDIMTMGLVFLRVLRFFLSPVLLSRI